MEHEVIGVEEAGKLIGLSQISIRQARTALEESYYTAAMTLIAIMKDEDASRASRAIAASVILLAFKSIE